jgi:hypothetical protein
MTNQEYRKSVLADCSNAATDCRDSADYAEYGFRKGDEAQGRTYTKRLEERLSRLLSAVHSLDYINGKIAQYGPDAKA